MNCAQTVAKENTRRWIRAAFREVVCCVLQNAIRDRHQQQQMTDSTNPTDDHQQFPHLLETIQDACKQVATAWKSEVSASSENSVVHDWIDQVLEEGRESLYMETPPRPAATVNPRSTISVPTTPTDTSVLSNLPTIRRWKQVREVCTKVQSQPASSNEQLLSVAHSLLDPIIEESLDDAHHGWYQSFLAEIPRRLHVASSNNHLRKHQQDASTTTEDPDYLIQRKRKRYRPSTTNKKRHTNIDPTICSIDGATTTACTEARPPDSSGPTSKLLLAVSPQVEASVMRRFLPDSVNNDVDATLVVSLARGRQKKGPSQAVLRRAETLKCQGHGHVYLIGNGTVVPHQFASLTIELADDDASLDETNAGKSEWV